VLCVTRAGDAFQKTGFLSTASRNAVAIRRQREMKNFLGMGETVTLAAAPEAVDSGEFIMVGALFGVAQAAADSGAEVVLVREGVFELPKATGAWTQGDTVYWDASAKNFTKTATGNKPVGVAFADALSGDTTGAVSIEAVQEGLGVNLLGGVGAGYKIARGGAAALDGSNPTPIATGLATIVAAFVQLRGTAAPGDNTSVLTTDFTGSDGTLNVYAWKNTSGSDPTLVASTGTETFDWIAVGT
jgi:predicted RecA/RadA family phage recombinase